MAQGEELSHHYISQTALPYISNGSVTDKDPVFESGSENILTSIRRYFEKRRGFGYFEADTTFTFSGTVRRFFTWPRWTGTAISLSGSYFVMANDVSATASRVWKQRYLNGVAQDAYPSLIHTDATSTNPFDFVVSNNFVFFGNGVDMKKYDGTTVTNWGITGPAAAVTFSSGSGSLSPTIGFQWVISWENSSTGQLSSPSALSASTGAGSSVRFTFTGNTTSDTQVDQVRFGRTVDGGSIFFEHPASPITYATWIATGYIDNTADSSAGGAGVGAPGSNVMPLPNQNNRPTASQGGVWFANRLWTFINDTVYYSDFEELVRGVEEESFAQINLRFFGKEIFALAVAGQFLLIFTADTIYRIYGDSLATFRMDVLAEGKGVFNRAAVVSFNGLVAWLDVSNTVWYTDGQTIPDLDLSAAIRPDIETITHSTAAMAYHRTGNSRWLILMDGGAGKLYVYDLDLRQWMPPWTISGCTAIYSGQTRQGTTQLFLARSGTPLVLGTNYQDGATSYPGRMRSNLFDMAPENPSMYGILDHIEIESGTTKTTSVGYLTDEDPSGATYTATASATGITPPNRTQGTNLVETWYQTHGDPNLRGARRVSVEMSWAASDTTFLVYGFALGYQEVT